jgi:PAS domain S-box-containing protein
MGNKYIKGSILVVDDNKDLSEIIKEELENENYYVKTAQYGKSALKYCKEDDFDLGLIDHNLINYTSLELIKELNQIDPSMDYIIITGQASLNNAIKAFQHNKILYYEEKPINFDRLISFIDQRLEWVEMEKSLRKNEKKFRQIFNNVNDAIYLHKLDKNGMPGDFVEVNELACHMLGYNREELLHMSHKDIDLKQDYDDTKTIMQHLLDEGSMTYETTHVNKEGQEIPVEISSHIFNLDDENVVLSVARDITRRKQAEAEKEELHEQLLQTQKLESIGQLAGGVAHDFNNILTVITCQTEMLKMNMDESNPNYSGLESIYSSINRAKKLTQQLLLFSRKQPAVLKSMDLNNLIEQVLKMIKRLIGENIKIETDLADDLCPVKIDEGQIEQVIINLAINARDAMPEGGILTIRTLNMNNFSGTDKVSNLNERQFVRLIVEDTGKGISSEVQEKIFDPFFTTKSKSKGTGMGLSVVYGIIKKHNGWIDVESQVGQGSRFIIDLPVCKDKSNRSDRIEELEASDLKGNGEKILMIEDEKNLIKAAQRMLEVNNYRVDTALNGAEAINKLDKKKRYYDLIISDVLLPDTNAFKLLDKFKKLQGNVPIIFCSGYTDERSKQELIANKGIPFIQKPYQMHHLIKQVKKVLEY